MRGPAANTTSSPVSRSQATTRNGSRSSANVSGVPLLGSRFRSPSLSKRWSSRVSRFHARAIFPPGNTMSPRSCSQVSTSRSTPARFGIAAMTDAFHAPAEVPTSTSGTMSRSSSARSMPTWQTAWLPPPESTNAVPFAFVPRRRSWLIVVLTGPASSSRTPCSCVCSNPSSRREIPGRVHCARFVRRRNLGAMLRPKSTPTTHTSFQAKGAGGPRASEFYRNYLAVAVFVGAALLMVGAMLGVGRLLRPKRPQTDKFMPYEAGSDPLMGFGQSNVRYYVYALLFVMFDVEAVFIFPWAVRLESLGTFGLIEMIVFIVILALGLVYAWRKGVLRWA